MKTPLHTRLLIVAELLLIGIWIYLLFQWHASAGAGELPVLPTSDQSYSMLRENVNRQLQDYANPPVLALAGPNRADSDLDPLFAWSEEAVPVTAEPAPSLVSISRETTPPNVAPFARPLPRTTETHQDPVTTVPVADRHPTATSVSCTYRLSAIIRGNGRATVVLVNTVTQESVFAHTGQQVGDWLLTEAGLDTVTLRHPSRTIVLRVE